MRSAQYEQGRRNGIKSCIEWLHTRADEMNDPHARAILNSAAFGLGQQFRHGTTEGCALAERVAAD